MIARVVVVTLSVLVAVAALGDDGARVIPYVGYGTPDRVFLTGRAVRDPRPPDGRFVLDTVAKNLDALESDEIPSAPLVVEIAGRQVATRTDPEGLFALAVDADDAKFPIGALPFTVELARGVTFPGEVLVVDPAPGVAVVSDFDDTVVNSYVRDKAALLLGVLTRAPDDVELVPGVGDAYRRAAAKGARAFFYVSGSPLALYERVDAVLRRGELPRGPILLKNVGEDPLFAQEDYKRRRIEELFARLPELRFVLVGDSGERDPEIYAALRAAHPDRVAAILIRRAPDVPHEPGRFKEMFVVDDHARRPELLAELVVAGQRALARAARAKRAP